MARRIVSRSRRDFRDRIIALCNPTESWSPRPSWLVINDIDSQTHEYVVEHPQGDVKINVVQGGSGAYLRTDWDETPKNNLDDLARCGASDVVVDPNLPNYLGNYPTERQDFWTNNAQGLAHDRDNWFITQTSTIWRVPITHDLKSDFFEFNGLTPVGPSDGLSLVGIPSTLSNLDYNHFGDPDVFGQHLFVPVEGHKNAAAIAAFRVDDLGFVDHAYLPGESLAVGQKKSGWCAIDPDSGFLYTSGGTVDERNPLSVHSIDHQLLDAGTLAMEKIGELHLVDSLGDFPELMYMQGGVFGEDGRLYIMNGYYTNHSPDRGGIWIVDPRTGRLIARSSLTDKPFKYEYHHSGFLGSELKGEEPEGLTWWDLDADTRAPGIAGQLHAILLDNDWPDSDDVYIKHYEVL